MSDVVVVVAVVAAVVDEVSGRFEAKRTEAAVWGRRPNENINALEDKHDNRMNKNREASMSLPLWQ